MCAINLVLSRWEPLWIPARPAAVYPFLFLHASCPAVGYAASPGLEGQVFHFGSAAVSDLGGFGDIGKGRESRPGVFPSESFVAAAAK